MVSRMTRCACGHPVRILRPKGSALRSVVACEHCSPTTKKN